jgi:hypothetical protein
MLIFAGIAGFLCWVAGSLVTARLFSLARRTRGLPENLLAVGLGGLFCVGYPMAAASRAPGLMLTHEGSLFFALGAVGIIIGVCAISRFPYIVFRPGARWASFLSGTIGAAGCVAGIAMTYVIASAYTREEMFSQIQPWAMLLIATLCISFLWNATESFLYYWNMKRRLALDLADPETTHRFLLWGLASGCSLLSLSSILFIRGTGQVILDAFPMTIIALGSVASSACWSLAFFMPSFYRHRVVGVSPKTT